MAINTSPFNIIAAPADVWVAVSGTSFPNITDAPAVAWKAMGKTEGGVTATHNQSLTELSADQVTSPLKVLRTEETLMVEFNLAEIDLEKFAFIMNQATVTTNAAAGGQPAHKVFPFYQGVVVKTYALIMRVPSPYGDFHMQYEIPFVIQAGEPSLSYQKADKAVLNCSFKALVDPNAGTEAERFGRVRAQTA